MSEFPECLLIVTADVEQKHLPVYAGDRSIAFNYRAMKGDRAEATRKREKDAGQGENTHREGLLRQALSEPLKNSEARGAPVTPLSSVEQPRGSAAQAISAG